MVSATDYFTMGDITDMKTLLKILLTVLLTATAIPAKTPATSTAPAPKAPAKKKVYELPKTGMNLQRSTVGWLNIDTAGTRLILKFYDKDKKPTSPDVARGFAQFRYSSRNPERAPLNREGDTLTTPAKLKPPHNFLVIISLFADEAPDPVETYSIKYP
jgi:hypothetical protein